MSRYAKVSIVFLALLIGSLSLDGILSIPIGWYILLVASYAAVTVYGSAVLSARYFVKSVHKGNASDQTISITFDDGPVAGMTDKILDILRAHQITAAFFCIGSRVEQNPGLLKRIHEEGHLIGNHSFTHTPFFDLLPSSGVMQELKATNAAIQNAVGLTPNLFRPPYGITNPMIARAVNQGNFGVVGWSVRSFDTLIRDKSKLFNRVTRKLKAGDIVLLHDYCESTIEMLPEFLDFAAKRGLKIVRVDKLLNIRAYV